MISDEFPVIFGVLLALLGILSIKNNVMLIAYGCAALLGFNGIVIINNIRKRWVNKQKCQNQI